jgi:hypothetical protein
MDVSLVWADDMEEGLIALAVDEEIDQLRLEIASLRREFFVDEEKRPARTCNAEAQCGVRVDAYLFLCVCSFRLVP